MWPIFWSLLSPQDVEECQLSECGAEEELVGGDAALQRSSSTSDITQQASDPFPGTVTFARFLVSPGQFSSDLSLYLQKVFVDFKVENGGSDVRAFICLPKE